MPNTNINFGAPFDGQPIMSWDGQMRPYEAQIDNYAALFNNPVNSQVNVAIPNSSEVADFRFSLTRQDNEALSLNSKNSKNIANLNSTFRISKRDRTSTMYPNNNTFVYPSFNTSLILSDAISFPRVISEAKLRGSWGDCGQLSGHLRG